MAGGQLVALWGLGRSATVSRDLRAFRELLARSGTNDRPAWFAADPPFFHFPPAIQLFIAEPTTSANVFARLICTPLPSKRSDYYWMFAKQWSLISSQPNPNGSISHAAHQAQHITLLRTRLVWSGGGGGPPEGSAVHIRLHCSLVHLGFVARQSCMHPGRPT
jgi:hypothetical protein